MPVPCYCLTHLAQRLTRHPLDLRDLLGTAVGFLFDEVPRQFALERDHGERVSQQVMQITRQAQPFFLYLQASKFPPSGMQFSDGAAHAGHADHVQTQSPYQQHQGNEPPPIDSCDASINPHRDEEREKGE